MSAIDAFRTCLDFTRAEEGGYTCRAEDSGNWSTGLAGVGRLIGSNMGVSAPTLISWLDRDRSEDVTPETMRHLPEVTYEAIARAQYWRSLNCDGLAPSIALMVFDYGWNVGVAKSARLLQTIIGVDAFLVDGDLGPKTLESVRDVRWPVLLDGLDTSAIKMLQKNCGVVQDGHSGPDMLAALASRPELRSLGIVLHLSRAQAAAYRRSRNFAIFGEGWIARTRRRLAAAAQLPLA